MSLQNLIFLPGNGLASAESPKVKSCTVDELRDMLQDIHVLAEQLSVSLSSELHYNHKMFTTLTDAMPEGLLITDGEGDIRVTSSKALELLHVHGIGLNGTNILDCFPLIPTFEHQESKNWTPTEFSAEGSAHKLDVLVSKIELGSESSQVPGSNCVVLIKQTTSAPQELGLENVVNRYTLTSDVSGDITYLSQNLIHLMTGRSSSLISLKSLLGAEVYGTFILGNCDPKNVDVSLVTVEVADLDARNMIIYKTNVLQDGTQLVIGYSIALFDISTPNRAPTEIERKAVNAARLIRHPSILVQTDDWKALYCNPGVNKSLGLYSPDIIQKNIFTELFGGAEAAKEMQSVVGHSLYSGQRWEGYSRILYRGLYSKCLVSVETQAGKWCIFTFKELE